MKSKNPILTQPFFNLLVLALAGTLLPAWLARAVPYASQVTRSGNTVSFVLNQNAQGLVVVRAPGASPVYPGTTAGVLSFDMTGFTTYSIIVTGNTAKAWTQFIADGTDRNFEQPKGVAINRNPASTDFGKVYVSNGRIASSGAGRACSDGIYVMRADGVAINSTPYTGGLDWTADGTLGTKPWRATIGPDDHVYVSSYYDDFVYEFNADMSTATQLIDDSNKTSGQYVYSLWVEGTQAAGNRKLYLVNWHYTDTARKGLIRYDLGANATATPNDTGTQVIGPGYWVGPPDKYYPYDVTRDSSGYFYLNQYRGTAGQAPAITKFDVSGTLPVNTPVWEASSAYTYTAGLDLHEPSGRVATSQDAGGNNVYIFDMNTGSFVESFQAGISSARPRELAFDAAGNIVTIDNIKEYARYWSPGGYSVATTKSDGTFDLITTDNLSVTATDAVASETGPDTATFTINRSGGLVGDLQVSYTLTGTATPNVDYTVSPTSPFTFPANQSSATVTITPIDDGIREQTETVVLTLSSGGSAYSTVSPTSATAYILDNDMVLQYWDTNDVTAGATGDPNGYASGTWGTDAFWSTDPAGAAATGAWYPTNAAVFSAGADAYGAFTVTLNGAQRADTLVFEEGLVTLEGGPLTLTNFSGIQVASGLTATINSILNGQAGLTVDGPGTLVLGGANTYTGPTLINNGTVQLGAADRIPDTSAVTLGNSAFGTVGTLDLGLYTETIASLDGVGISGSVRSTVNVSDNQTLVFGGNNNNMFYDGTTTGNGLLAKVGTGTLDFGAWGDIINPLAISNGVLKIDSEYDLGGSGTATPIYLDGGLIRRGAEGTLVEAPFPGTRSLIIGPAGGTLEIVSASAVFYWGSATEGAGGTIQGGVLTCQGPGEFRTYNNHNTNAKLIVKDGFLFSAGQATLPGFADSFGAVPAVATADAITLQTGGQIRKVGGANVALDPKQGIFIGTGGGVIRGYDGSGPPNSSGTFEITGAISGGGPLQLNATADAAFGPIIVLSGANTYSGPTTIPTGSVFARNTTGSATGSGTVTVAGGTLGGDGIIGGPVLVQSSTLSPGYKYNTGPQPVGFVDQPIAKLTLTNGLNLSSGGIDSWQLGALSTNNPGTDWDQVELTGGTLTLGGSSVLSIGVTGAAMGPTNVFTDPFWQTNRQWRVIKFGGGGSISGNFSTITGTNGWTGGTFATTVDGSGVNLVFTTAYVTPTAVTSISVAQGPAAGQVTVSYSGGAANQFVLMRTNQLTSPITSREGWERVATTNRTPAAFTISPGADPAAFYYIQSE